MNYFDLANIFLGLGNKLGIKGPDARRKDRRYAHCTVSKTGLTSVSMHTAFHMIQSVETFGSIPNFTVKPMEVGNKSVRHRAEHAGSQRPATAITRAYIYELIIKHLCVGGGFSTSLQMTVGTEQSSYHISQKYMNRLLSLYAKNDALIFISIFSEFKYHRQSYVFMLNRIHLM